MFAKGAPWLILALWLTGTLTALWAIEAYKAIPGDVESTPVRASNSFPARPPSDRPQLLLFVHPKCPCSRASVSELAEILAEEPGAVAAEVVLVRPAGADAGWEQSPLSAAAAKLPGVRVTIDDQGTRASQYGVKTSGHVLLYDAQGRLLFSGGITRTRGHAGDNAGRRSILAAIRLQPPEEHTTPVFGCALLAPEPGAHRPRAGAESTRLATAP